MAFLETFLQQMMSNDVSAVFTWLIAIFFIVALIGSRLKSDRILANLSGMAPNILTTLGILGTFTGIFIGLLDFDVQQINKSVPALLEGLKIAFGTSILGLVSALIFRVIRPIISSSASEEENVDLTQNRGLLHCHHKDGNKGNNKNSNLSALCVICHKEHANHGQTHVKGDEKLKLLELRAGQNLPSNCDKC